ncbi:MAG TPA: serine hydrolase domain-containing protein [Planctomycetota bacterium]|nr:serine hydrolase domain-containing protein [Planctomycetota bacterium]
MNTLLRTSLSLALVVGLVGCSTAPPRPPEPPSGPAAVLLPFVERHALAGAVTLVASKDKILSHEAVGYLDLAAQTPMRPDAVFWIASQSKPITATAFMMLVDEGKVSLDDPVEKYLPEFKGLMVSVEQDENHVLLRKPAHPITIRNVLSHTSGMRFSSAMEKPTLDMLTLRDAVRSYALTPLQYEPDTKYQYSNAGINTAARILEVVSGTAYEDFLQKRLFDPLGLKDTTFWPSPEQVARLAKAYKPNASKDGLEEIKISQLTYPLPDRRRQPMPAGGLFSTATDVARFCQMILAGGEFEGHRYLSEKAIHEMTTKQTPEALKEGYGLGWSTGASFGHGGALSTNMSIDPKKGLITVWLVQHSGFPGDGQKSQGAWMQAVRQKFDP